MKNIKGTMNDLVKYTGYWRLFESFELSRTFYILGVGGLGQIKKKPRHFNKKPRHIKKETGSLLKIPKFLGSRQLKKGAEFVKFP